MCVLYMQLKFISKNVTNTFDYTAGNFWKKILQRLVIQTVPVLSKQILPILDSHNQILTLVIEIYFKFELIISMNGVKFVEIPV